VRLRVQRDLATFFSQRKAQRTSDPGSCCGDILLCSEWCGNFVFGRRASGRGPGYSECSAGRRAWGCFRRCRARVDVHAVLQILHACSLLTDLVGSPANVVVSYDSSFGLLLLRFSSSPSSASLCRLQIATPM
ncbi:unnamed protein product, partial [Scytosiphon promiscuus]